MITQINNIIYITATVDIFEGLTVFTETLEETRECNF